MPMSGLEAAGGAFQTGASGDLVYADRQFAELLGFDAPAQALGRPLSEMLPEADLRSQLARAGGRGMAFRTSATMRGGNRRNVILFARLEHDGINGVVVPAGEAPPPAHADDPHGQKLEILGRLAGGVAHDFNNILTAIGGYVELMLTRMPENDANRDSLREIRRQADRAARLTRQLLAFGRRQVFQLRVARLNGIVTEMFRMLERVMGDQMSIELDLDPALGHVRVDRGQFEQVVMNLVLNARDALGTGGRVTLRTANVELKERVAREGQTLEPGQYVRFCVIDNGIGMDTTVRSRLFEPFFTSKKGKGTGLGLSQVYGIIKQSGGSIFVESSPGKGATFDIYLPRVFENVEESSASTVRPSTGGAETVLVAEDEAGVRNVVVTHLRHKGYQVLEAGNGEEALRVLDGHAGPPIHLLLTDIMMPGMNGTELADAVVKRLPKVRVLFMTGYTDQDIEKIGFKHPGSQVLHKPFRLETLAQKVREALDLAR